VDTLVAARAIRTTGFFEIRNNVGADGDNFLFFRRLLQDLEDVSAVPAETNLQRVNIVSCTFATPF
jgi:hypothetical protein